MSEQTGFLVAMMASGAGLFVILVVLPFFATIVFPYALLLQIGKEEQVKRLERKVLLIMRNKLCLRTIPLLPWIWPDAIILDVLGNGLAIGRKTLDLLSNLFCFLRVLWGIV